MAMEVVQALAIITIYYPTLNLSPEVHFELVTDKILYTRINRRIQFHEFGGSGVIWPGNVTVTPEGIVSMQFEKKVPEMWDEPFKPMKSNITNADVPKIWNWTIIGKEKDCENVYVYTIRPTRRMYFHMCIGHYIMIYKDYWSWRYKKVLKASKQFTPVPTFPLMSLENPNAPPGKWTSMLMNINLVSRSLPEDTFGGWLAKNNSIGSVLQTSDFYGTLFLPVFNKVQFLHFLVTGSGITGVMGLLLYLFQMTKIQVVNLIYFSNVDTEIIMRNALTSMMIVEKRLKVKYIIKNPSLNWRGLRGKPSSELIRKYVPKFEANTTDIGGHYTATCGHTKFTHLVERCLMDEMAWPFTRIQHFLGT